MYMWYQDKDTEQFRSVLSDLDIDTVRKILHDFGHNKCYMMAFDHNEKINMLMCMEQNDRNNMEAYIVEILGKNGCNYEREWRAATQTLRDELMRMINENDSAFRFDLGKWESAYGWFLNST